jgi:hypothetical protein
LLFTPGDLPQTAKKLQPDTLLPWIKSQSRENSLHTLFKELMVASAIISSAQDVSKLGAVLFALTNVRVPGGVPAMRDEAGLFRALYGCTAPLRDSIAGYKGKYMP